YRILVMGAIDHYVTLKIDPERSYGVAGNTEWLHGHGDMYRASSVYVPRGTRALHVALVEYDLPRTRRFTLKDSADRVLFSGDASAGFVRKQIDFDRSGQYDDQILVFEVSAGAGDFMAALCLQREEG